RTWMSPGSRNSGRPSIITRPRPVIANPMRTRVRPIRESQQFDAAKKVPDLGGRRVGRVRSVRRVALDGLPELLARRARVGPGRIGGAHDGSPLLDGVPRFEREDNRRPRRHELGQALEERPFTVDGVESFRLAFGQTHEAHGTNLEPFSLDALHDRTGEVACDGIRLYDGQRPFGHQPIISAAPQPHDRRRCASRIQYACHDAHGVARKGRSRWRSSSRKIRTFTKAPSKAIRRSTNNSGTRMATASTRKECLTIRSPAPRTSSAPTKTNHRAEETVTSGSP